jgi:hypothetical protein
MPETVIIEIVQSKPVIIGAGFTGPPGRNAEFPSGLPGQVISYDAEGNLIAIDPAAAGLPPGSPRQLLGYDEQGVAGPIDPFIPLETVDW